MVRDCLDGSMFKDIVLSAPISRAFIRSLATLGTLEYFPRLPRPFFRLTRSGEFMLKGVQGNDRFQAMFVHRADEWEAVLRQHVEGLANLPDACAALAPPAPSGRIPAATALDGPAMPGDTAPMKHGAETGAATAPNGGPHHATAGR